MQNSYIKLSLVGLWLVIPAILLAQWSNGQPIVALIGQGNVTESIPNQISASTFNAPTSVAIDPTTGKLFVSDGSNHRILRFSSTAAYQNGAEPEGVLGQPDFLSNQFAVSQNRLNTPSAIAIDRSGRLYVADQGNRRVLRFDFVSQKQNGANADGVLGQPNFTQINTTSLAQVNASLMFQPISVAVDTGGNLYVGEFTGSRVLRFNNAATKANGAAADAVLGQPDFTTTTAGVTRSKMNAVFALTCDTLNTLYVGDRSNNRLLIFRNAHLKASGADADSVLGQANFTTGAARANSSSTLSNIAGISWYRGALFVSNTARISRFDNVLSKSNNAPADTIFGQANTTENTILTANGRFSQPRNVAFDSLGNAFIADAGFHRVVRLPNPLSTGGIAPFTSVLGKPDFSSGNPNRITASRLGSSTWGGVAVDERTGKVFVTDLINSRVLRFSSAAAVSGGAAEAVFGQTDFNSGISGLSAIRMNSPNSLAFWKGSLWVSDGGNHRVLRFDSASTKPTGAPADVVLGQENFFNNAIGSTSRNFFQPRGLHIDPFGNLYVADQLNHRVMRFDDANAKSTGDSCDVIFGGTSLSHPNRNGFSAPVGVATGVDGALYVSEFGNSRVSRINNHFSRQNGDPADAIFGRGSTVFRQIPSATSCVVDGRGNLYVSDNGNRAVRIFSNAVSLGDSAEVSFFLGQRNLQQLSFAVSDTILGAAYGLALDPQREGLWVHTGFRAVLFESSESLAPPTGVQTVLASRSQYAFGNLAQAQLFFSQSVPQNATLLIDTTTALSDGSLPSGLTNRIPLRYRITQTGISQTTMFLTLNFSFTDHIRQMNQPKVIWRPNATSPWQRIEQPFINLALSLKPNYLHLQNYFGSGEISVADMIPLSLPEDHARRVTEFQLEQNYPNPFNPSTRIAYSIPEKSDVRLEVIDVLGRRVASLVNQSQAAGRYEVLFNASALSSGVYFYRLQTPSLTKTMKMVLMK